MVIEKTGSSRPDLAQLKVEHQAKKEELETLDGRIEKLQTKIGDTQAKIDEILGKKASLERRARLAEIQENVGAGWDRARTVFGKQLASLAGWLGQTSFTVTVADVEKDPTAEKTSARLRAEAEKPNPDLPRYEQKVTSWSRALEDLAAQREVVADQLATHAAAIAEELKTASGGDEKVGAAMDSVGEAANQVAHLEGEAHQSTRSGFFGGLTRFIGGFLSLFKPDTERSLAEKAVDLVSPAKTETPQPEKPPETPPEQPAAPRRSFLQQVGDLFRVDYEKSLAEKLVDLVGGLFGSVPVPVPVSQETPGAEQATPLDPKDVVTKPRKMKAEETGFPLVDARSIYRLPDPKTGREWVAMVAGLDYGTVHDHTHRERDLDDALHKMRLPIKYKGHHVKDVKRAITRLYGLDKKAGPADVRAEVDRRVAAGVDRFTNVDGFVRHLEKRGLAADATASQIAAQ